MRNLAITAIACLILLAIGLTLAAYPARAGMIEDIERAEAVMSQPWHIGDTLTKADRTIVAPAFFQQGRASWYGRTGRPTASGEKYPTAELTCAHRTLAFNTIVRVTALGSGRSIRCRINDRGPFIHGRVIDLCPRCAVGLGLVKPGVLKVKVEVVAE